MTTSPADIKTFLDRLGEVAAANDYDQAMALVQAFGTRQCDVGPMLKASYDHPEGRIMRGLFHSHWSSLPKPPKHLLETVQKFLGPAMTYTQEDFFRAAFWDFVTCDRRAWIAPMIKHARISPHILYDMRDQQLGHHIVQYVLSGAFFPSNVPEDDPTEVFSLMCDVSHKTYWGEGEHPFHSLARTAIYNPTFAEEFAAKFPAIDLDEPKRSILNNPHKHPYICADIFHILPVMDCLDELGLDLNWDKLKHFLHCAVTHSLLTIDQIDYIHNTFMRLHHQGHAVWGGDGCEFAEHLFDLMEQYKKSSLFVHHFMFCLPDHIVDHVQQSNQDPLRWPRAHLTIANHPLVVNRLLQEYVGDGGQTVNTRRM